MIGTLRSTAMEGSFGNQKQRARICRPIAARNSRSETLLLFPAIHYWQTPHRFAARQLAAEEKEKLRQRRSMKIQALSFQPPKLFGGESLYPFR